MRRLILYIAMSLSLISLSSAQQQNNHPPTGTCPAGLCFIQNTNGLQFTQHGASFNIDGSGSVGGGLSAATVSASTQYVLGGYNAIFTGDIANQNLFLGPQAGINTMPGGGQGIRNTFAGNQAGISNTTGAYNTFFGTEAGSGNQGGGGHTYVGFQAGSGSLNDFHNTAVGDEAGTGAGSNNTYLGFFAGISLTGDENIGIGDFAVDPNATGNNNIYIGAPGFSNESNAIHIGDSNSHGGPHTAAYIGGVYGTIVNGNGTGVFIDSNGQLGTYTSSRRFKEQIKDMGDSTDNLMKLRPVTFFYKPDYAKGDRTMQYGLIAEEVAEVYPDLATYDADGKPYSVRYQYLASMLLNEFQKKHHREEEQAQVIESQKQEIEGLRQQLQLQSASMQMRLSKLESLVERQTTVAEK